jgi:hypothetical protein
MQLILPVILLFLLSWAAAAQQTDPVQAGLMLSLDLQKKAVAAQDLTQALAAAKNRIAELEQLCGDPCKPKVKEEPK